MPLVVNLRHLEAHNVELKGKLPVEELDLDLRDELICAEKPLSYDLEVQQLEEALLLQGRLRLPLRCQCVRCLKSFDYLLELGKWTLHLPLEGEEKAVVVNDCVDLTPYLREDILLEFPQHPLCETDCRGLPKIQSGKANKTSGSGQTKQESSAWSELDKLKL
jgi:uncharacterized protein